MLRPLSLVAKKRLGLAVLDCLSLAKLLQAVEKWAKLSFLLALAALRMPRHSCLQWKVCWRVGCCFRVPWVEQVQLALFFRCLGQLVLPATPQKSILESAAAPVFEILVEVAKYRPLTL